MIDRRLLLFLVVALFAAGLWSTTSAQGRMAFATNFLAEGQVVELNIPDALDGQIFIILWDVGGKEYNRLTLARAGVHCYDMRHLPHWQGTITAIATTLPPIPASVKTPGSGDEMDMLGEAKLINPGSVNFIDGYTVWGLNWNAFLTLVFIAAAGFFLVRKKSMVIAGLLAFAIAWSVMDIRLSLDDLLSMRAFEKYHLGMFPLQEMKLFADRAASLIGRGTWGHENIDDLAESLLLYRLAEQQYVPPGSDRKPDFWITRDPAGRRVLLKSEDYYLVKTAQP